MVTVLPQATGFGSSLGNALGQGLSGGVQYGLQNALQQRNEISGEARRSELQKALLSHEYDLKGKNEQSKFQQELMKNQQLIEAVEDQRGLPRGSLSKFASDPTLAARITQPEKPKTPPKQTQASQPIDPDQLNRIQQIRNHPSYEKASPSKKYQLLTDAGVSKENAKAEADIYGKEAEISTSERSKIHSESSDVDKEITKFAKSSRDKLEVVKDIDEALKSGNVKPNSIANVLKGMGKIGDKIATAFLNKDQQTLEALIPQLLEGWKEVFGVRLSDADLKILQDKLPSIGKSPEANRAVLKVIKKYAEPNLLREQIARKIKKENGGFRPLNFADKIEEELEEMMTPIQIIPPNGTNPIQIPRYKANAAIKSGGKIVE